MLEIPYWIEGAAPGLLIDNCGIEGSVPNGFVAGADCNMGLGVIGLQVTCKQITD